MARRAKVEPVQDLEAALRRAIQECGVSEYELGKRAGVENSLLNRFVRGERTMTLAVASRVARALGLGLSAVGSVAEGK